MEYSGQKGKEIIEKFNLNPSILYVWKCRNSIPNKYNGSYSNKKNQITSEKDKQTYKMLIPNERELFPDGEKILSGQEQIRINNDIKPGM